MAQVAQTSRCKGSRLWRIIPMIGALTLSLVATGCAPGATATVSNSCTNPVDVFFDERPSSSVDSDFDLEVHRESAHTMTLGNGATRELGLRPSNSAKTVMIIVYGADTAKVDYFGDQLTGSLDYTITGDMCLTPATDKQN